MSTQQFATLKSHELWAKLDLFQCQVVCCTDLAYTDKKSPERFGLAELSALADLGEEFFLNSLLPGLPRYSKRIIGWGSAQPIEGEEKVPVLSFDVGQGPKVTWWNVEKLVLDQDCFEILLG